MGMRKPPVVEDRGLRSPTWTRTKNLPVNSRLLCQLSYRGMALWCLDTLAKVRVRPNRGTASGAVSGVVFCVSVPGERVHDTDEAAVT
jgi:hypothetical protein